MQGKEDEDTRAMWEVLRDGEILYKNWENYLGYSGKEGVGYFFTEEKNRRLDIRE